MQRVAVCNAVPPQLTRRGPFNVKALLLPDPGLQSVRGWEGVQEEERDDPARPSA